MDQQFEARLEDVGAPVRFYTYGGDLQKPAHLPPEQYAVARAGMPMVCVDGLACGRTPDGRPAVVLIVRATEGQMAGPFRGHPWVMGGKWDWTKSMPDFVRDKVASELGVAKDEIQVGSPIGNQLFGTAWAPDTDGPLGYQGVTLQFCYQVTLDTPLRDGAFRPDRDHSSYLILTAADPLPEGLHPYIKDVIQMSGWLRGQW